MKIIQITEPFKMITADLPIPQPKESEALLKILYCGICGADVASYTGNQPFTTYPRIPGHEFSAEIISIPPNARRLKVGDLVTANPYFNCKTCYSCQRGFVNCCMDNQTMGVQRDGSFCEYLTMPIDRIYGGKGLTAKQLALIEPFAISHHAVSKATIKPGTPVLIVGAGPIGLFALICAKLKGAQMYVADVLDGRLNRAVAYGAAGVINTKTRNLNAETMRITGGNGFDVCIEACGATETFLACIDNAAFAGNIVLIGNGKRETTFLHSVILKKELHICGSRNALEEDFLNLIDIVSKGKIDIMKMVSGVYSMEHTQDAFDALTNNNGSLAKLLVEISGS